MVASASAPGARLDSVSQIVHLPHFLLDLALTLALAAGVVMACRAVRLPAVVGLLLSGVLIGPSGLGWVSAGKETEVFAEIGVVALLFTLGLEFSRQRVREVRRPFAVAGPLQLFGTAAAAGGLALAVGMEPRAAVFFGFLVALSSTAVVLRLYVQRRELETPHGRLGLGVLLFQDLMLAPILAVTPLLAGVGDEAGVGAVAARFGGSLLLLVVVFLVARFLLPPFLGRLIGARLNDIFILAAVALCLGAAWLTSELGFSAALGAFLAGVLLAEADFSHLAAAEVGPFRDVFTNFFFISVGMLLDLRAALGHLPAVLGLLVVVVGVKAVVTTLAARLSGESLGVSLVGGLGLAQIGEFSFVLATVGRAQGLVGDEAYQVILAASALSLLVTPALVSVAPRVARRLARGAPAATDDDEPLVNHVVLLGYGRNGRDLGRVLGEARIPWRAVDLDRVKVREARQRGEPVVLGDAARREILEHVHVGSARVVVLSLSDPAAVRRALVLVRQLGHEPYVLARARRLDEIDELGKLGADEVMADELEMSIELVGRVLQRFHVPRNVIEAEIRVLRAGRYDMMRSAAGSGAVTRTLLEALERGTTEIFRLESGSAGVGKTLADLDLRRATGAAVVAVVRDGTPRTNPPADLELATGDDLVLVGGHGEIEAAFRLLGAR